MRNITDETIMWSCFGIAIVLVLISMTMPGG